MKLMDKYAIDKLETLLLEGAQVKTIVIDFKLDRAISDPLVHMQWTTEESTASTLFHVRAGAMLFGGNLPFDQDQATRIINILRERDEESKVVE